VGYILQNLANLGSQWWLASYALVVFLGAMSPGPDFAVVTRNAILHGRVPGLAAASGIAAGLAVNVAIAVAGMGTLIATFPTIYRAVTILGGIYLIWLGFTALRAVLGQYGELEFTDDDRQKAIGAHEVLAFRQGFVSNLLNPKTIVFLVTLMPQFLPRDPTLYNQISVGLVTVVMAFIWFAMVAIATSLFRETLKKPKIRKVIDGATALLLIGIGVKVAVAIIQ